jgi:hypothetical protein
MEVYQEEASMIIDEEEDLTEAMIEIEMEAEEIEDIIMIEMAEDLEMIDITTIDKGNLFI